MESCGSQRVVGRPFVQLRNKDEPRDQCALSDGQPGKGLTRARPRGAPARRSAFPLTPGAHFGEDRTGALRDRLRCPRFGCYRLEPR